MSSKIKIDVEVPPGKEVVIKQHTPETGTGKRKIPATSKVLISFKTGKGSIQCNVDGHAFLTAEEFDHDDN